MVHRRRRLSRSTVVATLILAALPDVLHLLPIAGWWQFGDGSFAAVRGYAVAIAGQEPGLPPQVQLWSHHLPRVMHSAPIAALATLLVWGVQRSHWFPALGWWSHIVIDVFTDSADNCAVPVLCPFAERGYDGIAWTTPWFMVSNYLPLAAVSGRLLASRRTAHGR